jgi:hypothetical protein
MSDQHELQSLDKLFRKTFDELPDTPAASGWDQPNPQVWQHLEAAIRPPSANRWRWQYSVALAGAIATAVAVLYFSNSAPKQEEPPAAAAQTDQRVAVSPLPQVAEQAASGSSAPPSSALLPVETMPLAPVSEAVEPERPDIPGALGLAEQLPGTIPAPPNTTEGLKAELGTIWLRPLTPLPSPQVPRRVEKRQ